MSTSGSRTSETGGKFFSEIFERPFLGVSGTNFSISPQNVIYLPKFLMTFFLVIDLFHVLMCHSFGRGGKIDTGGKILSFRQIHNALITLSAPEGGQTPLPTSMGGPWSDLPPWIMSNFELASCPGFIWTLVTSLIPEQQAYVKFRL